MTVMKNIIYALPLSLGVICLLVGGQFTYVDEQGVLHEFGAILPIGALLIITGLVLALLTLVLQITLVHLSLSQQTQIQPPKKE